MENIDIVKVQKWFQWGMIITLFFIASGIWALALKQ